jgi:hypothetical protein
MDKDGQRIQRFRPLELLVLYRLAKLMVNHSARPAHRRTDYHTCSPRFSNSFFYSFSFPRLYSCTGPRHASGLDELH